MDRCNLTILETPSHRDLAEFFAAHGVEVVASLPHYARLGTDRQRGDGVYDKSIRALRRLNEAGYGDGASGRRLVLVTNPVGAFLPGDQASFEREWKAELLRRHGVRFDALFTITNMPISRYLEWLIDSDNLEDYLQELVRSFNPPPRRGSCAATPSASAGTAPSTTATSTRCSTSRWRRARRETSATSTGRPSTPGASSPGGTASGAPPAPARAVAARRSEAPQGAVGPGASEGAGSAASSGTAARSTRLTSPTPR
jgi:hypothetical protein